MPKFAHFFSPGMSAQAWLLATAAAICKFSILLQVEDAEATALARKDAEEAAKAEGKEAAEPVEPVYITKVGCCRITGIA